MVVFTWSARNVAALVMGLAIISVSLYNVSQGFDDLEEQTIEVDTQRMAQMAEVMDHRPGAVVEMNFDEPYETVALAEDHVLLQRGENEEERDILMAHAVDPAELRDVASVCLVNNGDHLTLSQTCELPDMMPEPGPQEPMR